MFWAIWFHLTFIRYFPMRSVKKGISKTQLQQLVSLYIEWTAKETPGCRQKWHFSCDLAPESILQLWPSTCAWLQNASKMSDWAKDSPSPNQIRLSDLECLREIVFSQVLNFHAGVGLSMGRAGEGRSWLGWNRAPLPCWPLPPSYPGLGIVGSQAGPIGEGDP